jgi:hypothetical protein
MIGCKFSNLKLALDRIKYSEKNKGALQNLFEGFCKAPLFFSE